MKRKTFALLALFFTCTAQAQSNGTGESPEWDGAMVTPIEMMFLHHLCEPPYDKNINWCWAEVTLDDLREHPTDNGDPRGTVLYRAISSGYAGVINAILDPWAADLDFNAPLVQTESGDTPLILAARLNRTRVVEILLSADGIDADAENGDGNTAWDVTTDEGIRSLLDRRHN